MSQNFCEVNNIVGGFVPVDMQTAANTGDYVSLKNYNRCVIVLFKAAGTNGDDPTITLTQATDVAGTSVKNLSTITKIYTKQGTLTGVGTWTVVTQAAAATYTDTDSAENQAIWAIEVKAEDLDVSNGFDCLKAAVADVGGNAQLGCMFYIMCEPRYAGPLPSAIID
jgi:hypothetical protein